MDLISYLQTMTEQGCVGYVRDRRYCQSVRKINGQMTPIDDMNLLSPEDALALVHEAMNDKQQG